MKFGRILNTCFVLSVLLSSWCTLRAQHLTIGSNSPFIGTDVGVDLSICDRNGDTIPSLGVSDFSVFENGIKIPAITLSAQNTFPTKPCKTLFVVDRGLSMSSVGDTAKLQSRLQMIKAALDTALVSAYDTDMYWSLESFAATATQEYPMTTNVSAIQVAAQALTPSGLSDVNNAFFNSKNGALSLVHSGISCPRNRIVLISDGHWKSSILADSIVMACRYSLTTLYIISLNADPDPALTNLAADAGGYAVRAGSEAELQHVLSNMIRDFRNHQDYRLHWKLPTLCFGDESRRVVEIRFQRDFEVDATTEYSIDSYQLAYVLPSHNSIQFPSVDPNTAATEFVEFRAFNQARVLREIHIEPQGYFTVVDFGGKKVGDTLHANEGWTIGVQFTQANERGARHATLIVDADACIAQVDLFADTTLLHILEPNAFSQYNSCDSVYVKWKGDDSTRREDLWYTIDDNSAVRDWHLIDCNLSGGSCSWHNPNLDSTLRLRLGYGQVVWAKGFGSTLDETMAGPALNPQQSMLSVGGSFGDTLYCDSAYVVSNGSRDAFVARVDTAGRLQWMRNIGGAGDESVLAVCTDSIGNLYAAGTFNSPTLVIGSDTLQRSAMDTANIFLTAFSADGSVLWSVSGSGGVMNTSHVDIRSLVYDSGSIYLNGRFDNLIVMNSSKQSGAGTHGVKGPVDYRSFTAIYSPEGALKSIAAGQSHLVLPRSDARGPNGISYLSSLFQGDQENQYHQTIIRSRGGRDGRLMAWRHDTSAHEATVRNIQYILDPLFSDAAYYLAGSVPVHSASVLEAGNFLQNSSILDLVINSARLIWGDTADAQLLEPKAGTLLHHLDYLPLRVMVHPDSEGLKQITVELSTDCRRDTLTLLFYAVQISDVVEASSNAWQFYPNPSHGVIDILAPVNTSAETVHVGLYDMLGSLRWSTEFQCTPETRLHRVDVGTLPDGPYLFQVYRGSGTAYYPVCIVH